MSSISVLPRYSSQDPEIWSAIRITAMTMSARRLWIYNLHMTSERIFWLWWLSCFFPTILIEHALASLTISSYRMSRSPACLKKVQSIEIGGSRRGYISNHWPGPTRNSNSSPWKSYVDGNRWANPPGSRAIYSKERSKQKVVWKRCSSGTIALIKGRPGARSKDLISDHIPKTVSRTNDCSHIDRRSHQLWAQKHQRIVLDCRPKLLASSCTVSKRASN